MNIYFLVNKSNIRTTEKSGSDIDKLKVFAKNGYKTHSIEIKSFASDPFATQQRTDFAFNALRDMQQKDQIEELASKHKPKLIIAGWSSYPRDLDYERFRNIMG